MNERKLDQFDEWLQVQANKAHDEAVRWSSKEGTVTEMRVNHQFATECVSRRYAFSLALQQFRTLR